MKKRLLSLALCLTLCLGLLPPTAWATEDSVDAPYDTVKADGTIERGGKSISGDAYTDNSTDNVTWGEVSYVIRNDVTINGDLTINARNGFAQVFLCNGAKLTINGTLKFAQGSKPLHIFGQTTAEGGQTGTLIINRTDSGAAIQSESTDGSTLYIHSGKLEINSVSGDLVNNVKLEVENYYQESGDCKVMKATLTDASGSSEELKYEDWAGKVVSLMGSKLVIEYCDHRESDATYTHIEGTNTHTERCTLCSFSRTDECELYAVNVTNTTHKMGCYLCDNTLAEEQHSPNLDSTECVPTADGTGHSKNVCSVCQYPFGDSEAHAYGTDGSCQECGFRPFMSDSAGNLYEKEDYQEAFEKAAAGEVDWVQLEDKATDPNDAGVWTKSIEFNYSGEPVTLKMNSVKLYSTDDAALTVSGGSLVIEDNATIKGEDGLAGNSPTSAVKVTSGNLTFKNDLTATGGNSSSNAAPAIEVSGGKVTFEGAVNATGGLQGVSGNVMECKPAVYATGGKVDFQGDLDLNGGLTVTGDATLTNKLTKGTFRVEYAKENGTKESVNGSSVSVEGSKNYNYVRDLLADNRVFANLDPTGTNNKYFTASFKSLAWNVAIEEHTHTWAANGENYSCTVCGQTCAHEGGYKNGKCEVCGKPCTHGNSYQDSTTQGKYVCHDCGAHIVAEITPVNSYNFTYYTDLPTAMAAAKDGETVKLLDDVDNSNQTACVTGDNKTVTLDLKGHTITNGWIYVGMDNDRKNYTSSTLKITGSGSFITSGDLSVGYKATLDLSDWTSGTINKVSPSKSKTSNDESTLIVGENTGKIEALKFYNWPSSSIKNTKLTSGTYGNITITMNSGINSIAFSDLLAEGYAFQYTDSGEFVDYAAKAEYNNGGGSLYNVKVVKCPHDKVTNGTCDYCGKTGIAAMVDGVVYDSFAGALEAIKSNPDNRTLKLCADAQYENTALNSNNLQYTKLTIDLNGYTLSGADGSSKMIQVIDGAELVIQDTSESKNGSVDNIQATLGTTAGHLTLESGAIDTLEVAPDSNITLKAGSKVRYLATPGNQFAFPVAALLDFGDGLMDDSGNWADLTKPNVGTTNRTGYYTVTNIPNVGKHRGSSITATPYGRNTLPFIVDMTPDAATDVTQVRFQWYRADTNRDMLADFTCSTPTSKNEYVYDQSTKGSGNGWSDLTTGKVALLVCVVSGLDAKGNTLWCMSTDLYQLTITPPSLEDATVTFDANTNTRFFWPNYDNNSVGTTNKPNFTVTLGGKELEENTDYKVTGTTTATKIGTYEMKIEGISPNCVGEKTLEWVVRPHKLSELEVGVASKVYDGTTSLPSDALTSVFGSAESGYMLPGTITLKNDQDYKITEAHFDTATVGSNKSFQYTVELLNENYSFEDGLKTKTFVRPSMTNLSIEKADAPTVAPVELTITNDLEKTYELDLSKLLPTPESPKEYGKISYNLPTVHMDASYYTGGAKIENGKLSLPIVANKVDSTNQIGTVTVNVTTQNYEDITLTVNVIAKNKITPTGQPTVTGALTYGDKLSTLNLSGSLNDGTTDVPGMFTWTMPSAVPNAGSYDAGWTFTPAAPEYATATGTVTIKVNPKSIQGATVELGDSLTYNGSEQTQAVASVKLGETTLTAGTDYTMSGNTGKDAKGYELIIKGTGNYSGEVKKAYSIARKTVSAPSIALSGDLTYTGKEVKPAVTVKDGDTSIPESEYTVSYDNNTNAGTATVTITNAEGGNYNVSGSTTFEITKAAATCTAPTANTLTYNGGEQALVTAGTAKGGTMQYSLDGTNYSTDIPTGKDAGAYTVWYKVLGDNNHNSTTPASVKVSIGQKDITNAVITLDNGLTYNGTAQEQKIASVTIDGLTVTYEVSGNTATDVGTHTLTIKGTGNFTGTATKAFTIAKAASSCTSPELKELTYNGKEQELIAAPTTSDGTMEYKLGDGQWQNTVPKATNVGKYDVYYRVKGDSNHNDSNEGHVNVSIAAKDIQSATIKLGDALTYTGKEQTQAVASVTIDDLEATYDVSGNVKTDAGTYTLTVTGNGNFTGEATAEFTIAKAEQAITAADITATYGDTDKAVAASGTVGAVTYKSSDETTVTVDKDGKLTFLRSGSATITISAAGDENHKAGSKAITVTVAKKALTIKANDKSAYVGSTAPDLTTVTETDYTVTGLIGEDKLAGITVTLAYVSAPDMSKPGEFAIKPSVSGADERYAITCENGKLTISYRPSSGSTGTKTDTVKNPDGSTTKTETKADGSKTETTTATTPGGSTGSTVTKTDAKGNSKTEASAKLSDKDVKDAQEKGEAVTVPVKDIEAGKDSNSATEIKIDVPKNSGKTTVEIPVDNVTSGTVAVIVHPDGTEEIAKSSKPTEDGVQLEINGSTTVKIIDNSKDFIDTRDHWSRDEVNFVAARELFNGVGDNRFGVSQPMTRGMVNTVLARLSGVDTTPSQGQTWYEIGTEWAKKNGISDGTNPTGNVTREQLATLLYRYAGSPDVSGSLSFADANSVSDYAKNALLWANQNGIVNGVGNNTIAPKSNAERAQVAAMFARYLKTMP